MEKNNRTNAGRSASPNLGDLKVYLKRGKEESLLRFHPWVFSGAIHHADRGISEGDVVRVVNADGAFIAIGHYQGGSIAVRVLTFSDVCIDDAFWQTRLRSALNMRIAIGLVGRASKRDAAERLEAFTTMERLEAFPTTERSEAFTTTERLEAFPTTERLEAFPTTERLEAFPTTERLEAFTATERLEAFTTTERSEAFTATERLEAFPTNAYRLVHGEGDHLPGLIIDIYGETAVMQAHSIGMHRARHAIASALMTVMDGRLGSVYYKSESTLSFVEPESGFIIGGTDENIAVENGLHFYVDWLKGQKTGFFVDQRENRALLERYAAGRRVLNMFCYTGGFSFYAMRGGAQLVHSVDSSAKAVELTRRNVELNFPGDARHHAFCEDAFRFLDNLECTQPSYDLIILDPPAFAKHRGALHNALKGYTRLNNKAFEKIAQGGILFTFSCSQVVTKDHFRNAVFTAAAQAGRKVRILHQLHQPADHPINIYHPEGEYLKGLVLYVE